MKNNDLIKIIQNIFCDVLDDDEITLDEKTSADDIDDWDSLTHIQLIVEIEKKLNVKFTSKEILSWNNVGEMIECILTK